jgi:hypothetical protein
MGHAETALRVAARIEAATKVYVSYPVKALDLLWTYEHVLFELRYT